ncbi:MAG: cobyric acid synthase [Candidatus Omnitrophota bacterium]
MKARAIQICGTGSGVGKSVIVSALCRIFLQDGYKVCPFKAQNMALNSFVTRQGGEIGRAQATQALACRIEPHVDMNPVLLKPASDTGAQVIVRGSPLGNMNARNYTRYKAKLLPVVRRSFDALSKKYEAVVIEGAGSPAEINLKSHDIVNIKMARYAKAPVILVGDIDKGGVFASLVGTLELLNNSERRMIKGFIINKFRGDKTLLVPGLRWLEKRTGIKVLGVIPYFRGISIPEEDAVPLDNFTARPSERKRRKLDIAVIYLPHISNFTDFDPLAAEPDVKLRYVNRPEGLGKPDMLIIPGTKSTITDLSYLNKSGFAGKILENANSKKHSVILGICGGYQIMGEIIYDKHAIESGSRKVKGLGLLPVSTRLMPHKELNRLKAKDTASGEEVSGYEIHHGLTKSAGNCKPFFEVFQRNGKEVKYPDGIACKGRRVLGTYIHGLFDSAAFRRDFLNRLRAKKGWPALSQETTFNPDAEIDKLAKLARENIDTAYLYRILDKNIQEVIR